jgi:hypothetical protein
VYPASADLEITCDDTAFARCRPEFNAIVWPMKRTRANKSEWPIAALRSSSVHVRFSGMTINLPYRHHIRDETENDARERGPRSTLHGDVL